MLIDEDTNFEGNFGGKPCSAEGTHAACAGCWLVNRGVSASWGKVLPSVPDCSCLQTWQLEALCGEGASLCLPAKLGRGKHSDSTD